MKYSYAQEFNPPFQHTNKSEADGFENTKAKIWNFSINESKLIGNILSQKSLKNLEQEEQEENP